LRPISVRIENNYICELFGFLGFYFKI